MSIDYFKGREEIRLKENLKIKFRELNSVSQTFYDAEIVDISRTGLFIKTDLIKIAGTMIIVDLYIPDQTNPIHFEAVTARITAEESESKKGIGIRISNISESEKKRLMEFIFLSHYYGWFC